MFLITKVAKQGCCPYNQQPKECRVKTTTHMRKEINETLIVNVLAKTQQGQ